MFYDLWFMASRANTTVRGSEAISYTRSRLWQSLPREIKETQYLQEFKDGFRRRALLAL